MKEIKELQKKQYDFYSSWYNSVIRELITLIPDNANEKKLSKYLIPHIPPAKIKQSIKLQEELGIIKKKKGGAYMQANAFISGGGPYRNKAIVKYQKEMIENSKKAWGRFKTNEVSMHTLTLCMSEDLFEPIREEIRKFKKKIFKMVGSEKKNPERIYNMNLNLFPVTKSTKTERECMPVRSKCF